jgi:hypothetical protein
LDEIKGQEGEYLEKAIGNKKGRGLDRGEEENPPPPQPPPPPPGRQKERERMRRVGRVGLGWAWRGDCCLMVPS